VETSEPPEYCTFQGRNINPPSTRLGMDAQWAAAGVYNEESGSKPHQSSGSIPTRFRTAPHPLVSYSVSQKVLLTYTRATLFMEISNGCV